jgi:hypothetical protein
MNLRKLPILVSATMVTMLSACGQRRLHFYWFGGDSKGYQDCFKARLYERKLDYSIPLGDTPPPSLLNIRVNP